MTIQMKAIEQYFQVVQNEIQDFFSFELGTLGSERVNGIVLFPEVQVP